MLSPEGDAGFWRGAHRVAPVVKGIDQVRKIKAISHRVADSTYRLGGCEALGIVSHTQIVLGKFIETTSIQIVLAGEQQPAASIQVPGQLALILRCQGLVPVVSSEPDHHRVTLHALQR
jgi:hypothetical protein